MLQRIGCLGVVAGLMVVTACGSGVSTATPDCSGGTFWHGQCATPPFWVKGVLESDVLRQARAGRFQAAPKGYHYGRPIECRIDRPKGFHGADIYLCKIAIVKLPYAFLWEWSAYYKGQVHTHRTDPKLIPTITGPFDPPW